MKCAWGVGWLQCGGDASASVVSSCVCGRTVVLLLCNAHVDTYSADGAFCECGEIMKNGNPTGLPV